MNEFFTAVKNLLEKLGIKDVSCETYYAGIRVSGCEYRGYRPRKNSTSVEIDERKFKKNEISQCAAYIVESLPGKLEKKRKRDEEEKLKEEARAIGRVMEGKGITTHLSYDGKLLSMTFTHPDKLTIMAAIDMLQEKGFTEPIRESIAGNGYLDIGENIDTFLARQIKRSLQAMTLQARKQLVQEMYDSILEVTPEE